MLNELFSDFIDAAEDDLRVMEESRYFGFKSANSACFHAQQYAEKMIKARLIQLGFKIERTHNLTFLLESFDDTPDIERARMYCEILTRYEAKARYPMDGLARFSPEEAEEAYEMAKEIPYLIGLFDASDRTISSRSPKRGLFSILRRR